MIDLQIDDDTRITPVIVEPSYSKDTPNATRVKTAADVKGYGYLIKGIMPRTLLAAMEAVQKAGNTCLDVKPSDIAALNEKYAEKPKTGSTYFLPPVPKKPNPAIPT